MYYVGNIPCTPSDVQHFGIPGMKWGVRRYQNPDGTLTPAGIARYAIDERKTSRLQNKLGATKVRAEKAKLRAEKLGYMRDRVDSAKYRAEHSLLFKPSKDKMERLSEASDTYNEKVRRANYHAYRMDRRQTKIQNKLNKHLAAMDKRYGSIPDSQMYKKELESMRNRAKIAALVGSLGTLAVTSALVAHRNNTVGKRLANSILTDYSVR